VRVDLPLTGGGAVCVCVHIIVSATIAFWRKRYFFRSFADGGFWQNNSIRNYRAKRGGGRAIYRCGALHVFRCVGNKSGRETYRSNKLSARPGGCRPEEILSAAPTIYAPRNGCQKIVCDRVSSSNSSRSGSFENPFQFVRARVCLRVRNNRTTTSTRSNDKTRSSVHDDCIRVDEIRPFDGLLSPNNRPTLPHPQSPHDSAETRTAQYNNVLYSACQTYVFL